MGCLPAREDRSILLGGVCFSDCIEGKVQFRLEVSFLMWVQAYMVRKETAVALLEVIEADVLSFSS